MKSNKKIKTLLIVLYVLFSSTIFLNNFKNNPQDKEDSKNRKDTELKEADPAYQLMITDTDTFLNPDHPDINITTVEVDDNSTDVLFRLSVAGSINFLHQYHIFLDYNQDGSLDHTLSMIGGSFFWDSMTPLPKSFISGNSLILVVPKTLETDSTFNISALTLNSMTVSVDNAPGDAGWSFLYTWQVGVGIEEPHLTGVYSDYGVDTNSDGKFEYLAIDVEINATIAGYYRVVITYLTNTSDFIYVTNSTFAGNLAIGKHTITVLLLGSDILRSRIDGPYTLYQVQLKYNFSIADTKFNPYTTSYYQYKQFGAPPAFFTDKYSDAGVDLNGNGLFEYLNFTIEVNTTVTGNYTIHLWFLLDPLEKPMYVSNSMTCDLVVGIQNISIPISGTEIYSSGIDGPYTIWSLTLEDSYFYQLDSRIKPYTTTSAYSFKDFEIPEDYEYPIDFSITPENATLSFGGQKSFILTLWSSESVSDVVYINISGISTDWYDVQTPIYMLPYGYETVQLLVSVPDVGVTAEDYIMKVSVKSSNFNVSKSIDVNLTIQSNPLIYDLTPLDNEHLASNNIVFTWKTDSNCTTEVYLRKNSGSFTQYTDSGYKTDHSLIIGGLDNNTWYDFYVSSLSTAGYRTNSTVRSFYIEPGVIFTQRIYNFAIERDYDQNLTVTVKNLGDVPRQFLMTVYSTPPDLILGFVGEGSTDKIISLNPRQTLDVSLIVHAQDAMERNYMLTLELTNLGASPEEIDILDYAILNLTLKDVNIDFSITEIDDDPHTLTKTFNLTNYGDIITDFKVFTDYKLAPLIIWDPKINHLRLETDESIIFKVKLFFDWTFNGSRSGYLFIKAFDTIKNISINFIGDGEVFYGFGDASFIQQIKDWFCTNKPFIEILFELIGGIQQLTELGTIVGKIGSILGSIFVDGLISKTVGGILKIGNIITTGKVADKYISAKAAEIVKSLEGVPYELGAKGWCYDRNRFATIKEMKETGYGWRKDDPKNYGTGIDCSGATWYSRAKATGCKTMKEANKLFIYGKARNQWAASEHIPYSESRAGDHFYMENKYGVIYHTGMIVSETSKHTITINGKTYKCNAFHSSKTAGGVAPALLMKKGDILYLYAEYYEKPKPVYGIGRVEVDRGNQPTPRSINARAEININDNIIKIGPDTGITIKDSKSVKMEEGIIEVISDNTIKNMDPREKCIIETPTAVVAVRSSHVEVSYNKSKKSTEVIVYDGHVDIFNTTTDLERSITTDLEYGLTYDVIRKYNDSSGEYDLIFRNSTDLGNTWLVNQTLYSNINLANVSLAIGPNHTIFVVYEDSDTIYCITSKNNGSSWNYPQIIADINASEPILWIFPKSDFVFVSWANNSHIKPGIYFKTTKDAGKTWGVLKRGPGSSENLIEAFLEVDFGLPWKRESYRKHDVVISVNDHLVAMLNDTVPEGRYLFPIDPNYLNYGRFGQVAPNRINFDTYHMNGGHYVVSADCRIVIRLSDICIPIYCYSQKEADNFVKNISCVNLNSTDIGVYVNTIEAPTDMKQGEQTTINATIINIGDNTVYDVIVQFFQGNPNQGGTQIGTNQIIPSIMSGNNATVNMIWTHPGDAIHYIYVKVIDGTENYTDNNISFRNIVFQKAPNVTVAFPNIKVVINETKYITWIAEDPNYDFLLFSIYYGNGTHWNLIAENIDKFYYQWNISLVPNGDYKILVNVTDGFFTVNDTSDEFFTVRNLNYPVADAGSDQEVNINTLVNFDGSGSYDDIGIVEYFWDFGDGANATGMIVSHTYTLKPGESWIKRVFSVTLTVTDTDGLKDTHTIFVTINNPQIIIIGGDDDDDDDVLASEAISFGWFTVDSTTAAILIGIGVTLAIVIPLILLALVRPEAFLISKKRKRKRAEDLELEAQTILEEELKLTRKNVEKDTERGIKRKIKKKIKERIKKKLKKRKIVFIDLIYPPIALKNEPFNLNCFIGQRFTKNITIDANVIHSVKEKKKKEIFEKGQLVSLESLKPRLLSFQVNTSESTDFSFKVVVTAIKGKKLKKKFEVRSEKFEVKVLSLDDEQATKDLEMLYQTIDNEEKELINEFQEHISEFNVKSLDNLKEKISITEDLKKFSAIEKELGKNIKLMVENIPKIQDLPISEVKIIKDDLLSIYEQVFILTKSDIRINVPDDIEAIKDIKPYSKVWVLYISIMLKRLQKVEILKALYEIKRALLKDE